MPPEDNAPAASPTPTPTPSPSGESSPPIQTSSPTTPSAAGAPPKTGGPVSGEVPNELDQKHDFSALGEDFSDIGDIIADGKKETKEEPKPAPSAAPTSEAKTPEEAPKAPEPPKAPETPAAAAASPPATEQGKSEAPATIDDVLKKMADSHDELMTNVVKNFQLTADEVKALEENATEEVPKLLAKTYMRAVNTALRYMREFVPGMIERANQQGESIRETNKSFFDKWKQIDQRSPEQIAAIKSFAAAFRGINPNITQDELFNLVGTAVTAKFGLGAAATPSTPTPAPSAKTPAGFVPAGPGVQVKTAPVDDGAYAGLGGDFE